MKLRIAPLLSRGVLALVALWVVTAPAARAAASPRPYHEASPAPPRLVLTPGLSGSEFVRLLDRLEAAGLSVPMAVPGHGVVVHDAPEANRVLARESAVSRVLTGPAVAPDPRGVDGEADAVEAGLYLWWNEGWDVPADPDPATEELHRSSRLPPFCADAPSLENEGARCGVSALHGRVHFLAGRFAVNVILPEWTGGDPWTSAHKAAVYSSLYRATNWWAARAKYPVTFAFEHFGTVPVDTPLPALTMHEASLYIDEVLDRIRPNSDHCAYNGVDALNLETRDRRDADWAFTQFVLDIPEFVGSPGTAGYAYYGGPLTVALRSSTFFGESLLHFVLAHEMGHIFQALDEYEGSCGGCSGRGGYLEVMNGNCADCSMLDVPCPMTLVRLEYALNMEALLRPCWYTAGQIGLWDVYNPNGILDVMETEPETEVWTVLADTLEGTNNVPVFGRAWDRPYDSADPRRYPEPATINRIHEVEVSIDRARWFARGMPVDGSFNDREEDWEVRLPVMGGGPHEVGVRAVNTVGAPDPDPSWFDVFVFDVVLREPIQYSRHASDIALAWTVDGMDFGSTYTIWRREAGQARSMRHAAGALGSDNSSFQDFLWWDENAVAGTDYIYEVEADIPGKGIKQLGTVHVTAVLADPSPGSFVRVGPNPTRGRTLITVTVPRGPARDVRDGAGEYSEAQVGFPGSGHPPPRSEPGDGNDGGSNDGWNGGIGGELLWRDVWLAVYDVTGRLVREIERTNQLETTQFNAWWDGRDRNGARVPPGVYFVRTSTGYAEDSQKIIVLR